MNSMSTARFWKHALWAVALAGFCGLTGCMGTYSGQNLPSGYYLSSQVQYFPPGNQFPLTNEAAAQKEYRESQEQQQGPPSTLPPPPAPVQQ
ncbi:MAG TPA: hypothetical protein VMJ32_17680 [Pirellulales bacterium]|nr:hypothetical protein [Pirellulales bacterium]